LASTSRPLKLAPSILTADFGRLAEQIQEIDRSGLVDRIHVDVMDGVFVPNLSFGPLVVAAVRRNTSLPLDLHLMIVDPHRYYEVFLDSGATYLTVHVEACPHIHRDLSEIRRLGGRPGITFNPGTPTSAVEPSLSIVDEVLLMSVDPGYGGQRFIPESLERIRQLRVMLDRLISPADLAVDGGVRAANLRAVLDAGANVVVAGSAVFDNPGGITAGLRELQQVARC
jgi:ribulose-phosphate 3-epimerase